MKKVLVLIISILCVCSCGYNRTNDSAITNTYRLGTDVELVELEFNSEKT